MPSEATVSKVPRRDSNKINGIIEEYTPDSNMPLDLTANQQQGIIIDENNAQEVCEKIKHKKVTALILKKNKLRGEGMQIISRSLIEDPMCDIKFLDIGLTYLEIPGVSALARALSINSSLRILNMNLVNTRRFELSRLLDGVNSNRFLKRLYFKTTELFARGENKPRKAVDDMKQLVNFLETNKTLDAFDISGNAINPEMADELVNVMKYRNYSLKRFDMNSIKAYNVYIQQKSIDTFCEMNCHLDLIDYETLKSFGVNEVCHFLELLRCSKDCIAAAKKSKYTGSDFLAVMLEGRKEGGSFVPKIASGKFDLETAKRLRKYLCDHYCGFRLRARAVDGGEGGSGSARAFAISPRDVPQRVEFAHYDVSRVIELLHVYGEEKDMVRRFQVDRRPLDGRLFLELAGDGTLEQRLRDQGMSEDIVQHAKALQTALEKYGVSIERYAYSAVKFEANNIVADEDDLDSDDVVAAFDRVKRALSGLPYDKLEARVAGEMGDEELKKRIAPHGINEDDLRAILYLGSFDKVRDNYFLYNLNFNLEEGKDEFIREISDYICYVQRALNKLPTYQGTVYFVTTKTVEVNLTVDESIRFSPIVFATKSFDDIRAWVEDKPANYHIFKVHTKNARDTTVICSTFKNEVLLPIEYSYTVKKIKDNNIELEEEED